MVLKAELKRLSLLSKDPLYEPAGEILLLLGVCAEEPLLLAEGTTVWVPVANPQNTSVQIEAGSELGLVTP